MRLLCTNFSVYISSKNGINSKITYLVIVTRNALLNIRLIQLQFKNKSKALLIISRQQDIPLMLYGVFINLKARFIINSIKPAIKESTAPRIIKRFVSISDFNKLS